jgi:hypothetical protein
MDELHGVTAPLPPRLPQDTGINNRAFARRTVMQIMGRYPSRLLASGERPEPGDVLILRRHDQAADALQHAMIVGANHEVWHCGRAGGVCFSSIAGWTIQMAFRPTQKTKWL